MNSPVAAADSTSDDTSSNEDGDESGSCSKLRKLFRVPENKDIAYEFDSRVGLNGS
jgi:hypothetical protein